MMEDMAQKIAFSIPGEPKGNARPRVANGHEHPPSGTMSYEARVVQAYRKRYADRVRWEKGVPLRMRIMACYGVPAGTAPKRKVQMLRELPAKKPDADNIGRIVADALSGIAYCNDAQIVDLQVRKAYAEKPHVFVEIREAGGISS